MTDNKPKNNESLDSFFSSIGSEKKKIKEEKKELIGDISLDDVFSSLKEETKKIKEKKQKQKEEREKLIKDAKAFENFLFSDNKKTGVFTSAKDAISATPPPPKPEVEIVEEEKDIDEVVEALEQVNKEDEGTIDHAIKILDKLNEKNELTEEASTPELSKIRKELDVLKQIVNTQGGGGETRLQYLDDIVGIATNLSEYDGKVLTIETSGPTGQPFIFKASAAAGAGGTWAVDSEPASEATGIHTTKNVGIGTTIANATLWVEGDARVTGILTAPTFVGNLTGDVTGNADTATTLESDSSVNTSGIITASAFFGDGEGLTGVASTDNIVTGTAATFNNTVNFNAPILVNNGLNLTGVTTGLNAGVSTITSLKVTDLSSGRVILGGTGGELEDSNNLRFDGSTLTVVGGATFSGDVSVAGTLTYEDVTDIDSVGLITARSGINVTGGVSTITTGTGLGTVHIGTGNTTVIIDGDARVLGILTVGRGSVTIDGTNNTITSGIVTITNSEIILGENVTINASATGINSAPNVLYVAKDGSDSSNGTSIDNAFLTIGGACGVATGGTTIKVLSGTYSETNPIEVPANVSIVGDDQRSVYVSGSTAHKDIFSVRKGVKLANMTFQNHIAPAAAVGFPTHTVAENVGGGAWKGPYVQNCTSKTTTGTGIRVDGAQARSLKAMNVDAFTQYNEGGVGVAITNNGFAQLVSLFTICCDEAVTCDKGGQADIANSNCSFGTYGLVSRGVGNMEYSGIVTSTGTVDTTEISISGLSTSPYTISNFVYDNNLGIATVTTSAAHGFNVGMGVSISDMTLTCSYGTKIYPYQKPYVFEIDEVPSTTSFVINVGVSTLAHTYDDGGGKAVLDIDRPYDGQVAYFDTLYYEVNRITVTDAGGSYTSTPTVTIGAPTGPNGERATAYATIEDQKIKSITIINGGSQYTSAPSVTISGGGGSGGTATASAYPLYYTINSSTPIVSGISTLTLGNKLLSTVGVGSTAYFYPASRIIASSHTFEYVGSGNTITMATPKRGGVTVQANEVITEDGGKVLYTSTDQAGNFRIGDNLQINQTTGTISGRAFSKSLFSEMTPFILALS